ncbi:unnamed protein product [Lactuca virosa]|uniref:Uncharacterized protein n=1 Tax=Lactuca virosa TaxID=75947 RepID=A0AAU9MHT6_9ASTR|nr:unnamed protein product [Lactuca virosa]
MLIGYLHLITPPLYSIVAFQSNDEVYITRVCHPSPLFSRLLPPEANHQSPQHLHHPFIQYNIGSSNLIHLEAQTGGLPRLFHQGLVFFFVRCFAISVKEG